MRPAAATIFVLAMVVHLNLARPRGDEAALFAQVLSSLLQGEACDLALFGLQGKLLEVKKLNLCFS